MPPKNGNGKGRNGNGSNGNGNGNGGRKNGNGKSKSKNGNGKKQKKNNKGTTDRSQDAQALRSNQNYRPRRNAVERLTGSDYICPVVVKAALTDVKDHVLAKVPITPNQAIGTRIRNLAGNWERYKFREFTLRYVPSIPFTVGCQIMIMMDTDPNDDNAAIPDTEKFIRSVVSQDSSQQFNFMESKTVSCSIRRGKEMYYTGLVDATTPHQNKRFNYQGNIYVVQVTLPLKSDLTPLESDTEVGRIYLDWDMDVQTQQQNPEDMNAAVTTGTVSLENDDVVFSAEGTVELGTVKVHSPTWISTASLDFQAVAGLGTDIALSIGNASTAAQVFGKIVAPLGSAIDSDSPLIHLQRGNYVVNAAAGFAGTLKEKSLLKYVAHGTAPTFKKA